MKNDPKQHERRIRCESCHSRYSPSNNTRKRRHENGTCVKKNKGNQHAAD